MSRFIGQSYMNDIEVMVRPRYYNAAYNLKYEKQGICRAQDRGDSYNGNRLTWNEAVAAAETTPNNYDRPLIQLMLLKDGPFKIFLHSYREFPGLIRNPPTFAPVNLSEDWTRCERYYQSGRVMGIHPMFQNGTDMYAYMGVEMRERRHATRPYYRNNQEGSWFTLMGISFVVGVMLGATIALGYMSL